MQMHQPKYEVERCCGESVCGVLRSVETIDKANKIRPKEVVGDGVGGVVAVFGGFENLSHSLSPKAQR